MTIEFHCPSCDRLLRTPEDKAGLTAKCPGCGEPVTVPRHAEDEFAAADEFDSGKQVFGDYGDEPGGIAPAPVRPATKHCRMCGEEIKPAETRCRFCGEALNGGASTSRAAEGSAGLSIASMVLGIIGLVMFCFWFVSIPLCVLAVTFAGVALTQIKRGVASGKGMAVAGLICGMIPLGFWTLFFVLFFLIGIGGPFFMHF